MRIANTVNDSIVDGYGLRYVVFVQGCHHHCKGCHNPETHNTLDGREVNPYDLVEKMALNPLLDGVTISGGEPFLQAVDCAKFARACKNKGKTVWVYTGYTWDEIMNEYNPEWKAFLRAIDVLVDGRFVEHLKSYELHFRGSSNQRLIDVQKSLDAGRVILWKEEDDGLSKFTKPQS